MIILLKAEVGPDSDDAARVVRVAAQYPDLRTEVHSYKGAARALTEVHLIGKTAAVPVDAFEGLPGVERVIRVSEKFRTIARHSGNAVPLGFSYNGIEFTDESFHLFPGLCAVDNPKNVEATFKALQENGITTTRAGVYKPRTSPYDFQGHGKACLPWVLELAGKYGIKVIAMEVTRQQHVDEIAEALQKSGQPTGVMLQIGTRNAQNFELLRSVGQQQEFPVLVKRGLGITLEESLNAVEYVAQSGNHRIIFCLRGVKTHLGDPHRNFVDFAHVPVVRRLTRLPVCIDPSHSVGLRAAGPDGLLDIHHVTAQGIVAGANMVLVDFHPFPEQALCDGPQALTLAELPHFIEDCRLVRKTYEARRALHERLRA
ncbi:MAG: 3-deoxy-7-phosphoheptulonate synthase [Polyangia bacterium]